MKELLGIYDTPLEAITQFTYAIFFNLASSTVTHEGEKEDENVADRVATYYNAYIEELDRQLTKESANLVLSTLSNEGEQLALIVHQIACAMGTVTRAYGPDKLLREVSTQVNTSDTPDDVDDSVCCLPIFLQNIIRHVVLTKKEFPLTWEMYFELVFLQFSSSESETITLQETKEGWETLIHLGMGRDREVIPYVITPPVDFVEGSDDEPIDFVEGEYCDTTMDQAIQPALKEEYWASTMDITEGDKPTC